MPGEQEAIVFAPINTRLAVTAGPGTGKTYTLLERASSLIEQGLEPATELLIISFSRAAVHTVADRGLAETDLGRLSVRTIDSFASSLLFEAGIDGEGRGYDGRIKLAIGALHADRARTRLSEIRHVLIDEAQDIVGIRAEFLKALLEHLAIDEEVGFTILGDEAQAIYDFEMSGSTSRLLDMDWLEGIGASTSTLTVNHRMEPARLAPLSLEFGNAIRSPSDDPLDLWSELHHAITEERGWDSVENAASELKLMERNAAGRTIGVLCRTNAEVLALGSRLHREGVDLRVQHRAEDRGGAPWLARLFGDAKFETTRLRPEVDRSGASWMAPPVDFRQKLSLAGVMRRDEVQLGKLAAMLRQRSCPEELISRSSSPVVLSTIHRAKGLEFDVVYVVAPRWSPREEDALEEARVLYVAMTRARTDLVGCSKMEFRERIQQASDKGRAAVRHWSDKGWGRPVQFEVRVSDSDPNWHPETLAEFEAAQETLSYDTSSGDAMELRLMEDCSPAAPRYEIHYWGPYPQSEVVGVTSEAFGQDVARAFPNQVPRAFSNLVAEIPDTASFSPEMAARHGLPSHGLHLRARVYGLGVPSDG